MIRYHAKIFLLVLAATCAIIWKGQAQSKSPLNGTWNFSVQTSMGSGDPVFDLKHETDSTVTGTYRGALGESTVSGSLKGKDVYLHFTINDNLVEYRGTLDGKSMKGTVKLGTMAEGTFTAVKKDLP
jgi:hypothetical protein